MGSTRVFEPGALRRALALLIAWLAWPVSALLAALGSLRGALLRGNRPSPAVPPAPSAAECARRHPKSSPLLDLLPNSEDSSDGEGGGGAGGDADSAYGRDDRAAGDAAAARRLSWIGQEDLDWFCERIAPAEARLVSMEGGPIGDGWQPMMCKHVPGEVRRGQRGGAEGPTRVRRRRHEPRPGATSAVCAP